MGKGKREVGIETIVLYLQSKKLISKTTDIQISDGSGLSQRNFISPETLASFLRHQTKKHGTEYVEKYLARNGYDGTLKNAFTSSTLKGRIYGKSGSMGGVRAYSGILTAKSGRKLSFSIMVNNYTAKSSEIYKQIEKLMTQVYTAF